MHDNTPSSITYDSDIRSSASSVQPPLAAKRRLDWSDSDAGYSEARSSNQLILPVHDNDTSMSSSSLPSPPG